MKYVVIAALLAAGSLSGVALAEPLVCNEPWQPPSHPPVHPGPCHEPPSECVDRPGTCAYSLLKVGVEEIPPR